MSVPGLETVIARGKRLRRELTDRRALGRRVLDALDRTNPEAVFVEIGSNDGEQHDHLQRIIRAGRWSGVMVEPVPYVFERLRRNYADLDRVALENVAIADRDGTLPFWHLSPPAPSEAADLPSWYDGIGSFSKETLLGHVTHIPDIESRLLCREVPCLTFASLCAKHGLTTVDVLVIDTEGFDFEVVKTLDLDVHGPRLLVYEHFHLAPSDREACRRLVEGRGYETKEEGFDTWCLRPDDDTLTRIWRRIKPTVRGLSAHEER